MLLQFDAVHDKKNITEDFYRLAFMVTLYCLRYNEPLDSANQKSPISGWIVYINEAKLSKTLFPLNARLERGA